MTTIQETELLSFQKVQKILGVSRHTLRRLVAKGELPAAKIGRQWRFDPRDVESFLAKKKAEVAPPLAQLRLPV